MEILLYLTNTVCYAGQSATGKLYASKGGNTQNFNINKALSATALFLIWLLLCGNGIHMPTVFHGILYGLFLTVSMHFGFLALSIGPMALTGMIAAMSLIIPLFWGIMFWKETITLSVGIGILLLIGAIGLICTPKKGSISKKWICFSILTLTANGFCSVIQKYHQLSFPGQYQVDFMLYAMLTVTVLTFTLQLLKKQHTFRPSLLGTLSGCMNGLANLIVLYLAATENASQLFPLVSAVNVIAAFITGLILFHEKIKLLQCAGILAGIVGIVLLKI